LNFRSVWFSSQKISPLKAKVMAMDAVQQQLQLQQRNIPLNDLDSVSMLQVSTSASLASSQSAGSGKQKAAAIFLMLGIFLYYLGCRASPTSEFVNQLLFVLCV
jgi:hypothetical protein